jgi:methyltransferase (TIGR00027 family)
MFKFIFDWFSKVYEFLLSFFKQKPKDLKVLIKEHDVATTALLTNYWKDQARRKSNWNDLTIRQGKRAEDLYEDENLKLFYNQQTEIEATQRLDKRMWLPLATRTKYFRETISTLIKEQGVRQIVLLGSGFDTLAVQYRGNHQVKFFEIDHTKILACKESIYQNQSIFKNAQYIGMDYTQEDFMQALKQKGLNTEETSLVLWEGNTFYLEKPQVLEIMRTIQREFKKCYLSFDFMHPQIADEEKTMDSFAKKQSPFKTFFSVEEMTKHCHEMNLSTLSHFTTDTLARNYEVDDEPYHTAKPYSVITVESSLIRP